MKKFKTVYKLICFLLVTLLVSCYGEPDYTTNPDNKLTSIGEFAKAMAQLKGNGTILIQSNDYIVSQDYPTKVDVSERLGRPNAIMFFDANNQPMNILNKDKDFGNALYGKKLNYSILNEPTKSLYIPNLLKVKFDGSELKKNLTLTWNKDDLNYKGVIILITYKPTNQYYIIAKDNMDFMTHGFVTVDDGSYTFTATDFARFPDKSQVTINIFRTNYVINDQSNPSLVTFTTIAHDFIVKK